MKRLKFKVELLVPSGMDSSDMKEYILDAVKYWGNQYEPNVDPRFAMYKNKVKVSKIRESKCQSQTLNKR